VRLFFGLELPPQVAMEVAEWRDRQLPVLARPVPAPNFHITLAFLGELPASALESLCDDVDRWLPGQRPAADRLRLDQVGFWPAPGIYWIGPCDWPEGLNRLAAGLGRISARAGGRRERRRYRPHLTLFRGCREAPPAPATPPALAFDYRALSLFESRNTRRGVRYDVIADWPLT
jgi:2'-5' RNA ligase